MQNENVKKKYSIVFDNEDLLKYSLQLLILYKNQ